MFTADQFPVFMGYSSDNEHDMQFYGIPIHEYPGLLKVGIKGNMVLFNLTLSSFHL